MTCSVLPLQGECRARAPPPLPHLHHAQVHLPRQLGLGVHLGVGAQEGGAQPRHLALVHPLVTGHHRADLKGPVRGALVVVEVEQEEVVGEEEEKEKKGKQEGEGGGQEDERE